MIMKLFSSSVMEKQNMKFFDKKIKIAKNSILEQKIIC